MNAAEVAQIADMIRGEAETASRPGQYDSLYDLAERIERLPVLSDADRAVLERTNVVADEILVHFQELRMDTAEDEELRMRMLSHVEWWFAAVRARREAAS